jgi:hypothetical protein
MKVGLIIAIPLMVITGTARAIDSLEFQLYGVAADGTVFDIRPYGDNSSADGDVGDPDGIHGAFFHGGWDRKEGIVKTGGFLPRAPKGSVRLFLRGRQ